MEAILAFLQQAFDFVSNSSGAIAASVAVVLEFAMRLIKTDKPLSWLWVAKKFFDGAKAVLDMVSQLVGAVANFLDSILPQRTKEP